MPLLGGYHQLLKRNCDRIHCCFFAGQSFACTGPRGAETRDCLLNQQRTERVNRIKAVREYPVDRSLF